MGLRCYCEEVCGVSWVVASQLRCNLQPATCSGVDFVPGSLQISAAHTLVQITPVRTSDVAFGADTEFVDAAKVGTSAGIRLRSWISPIFSSSIFCVDFVDAGSGVAFGADSDSTVCGYDSGWDFGRLPLGLFNRSRFDVEFVGSLWTRNAAFGADFDGFVVGSWSDFGRI